jgi:hypothetical protein
VGKLHAEDTSTEMVAAGTLAVQPIAREYVHIQACRQLEAWVMLAGGTMQENQEASCRAGLKSRISSSAAGL